MRRRNIGSKGSQCDVRPFASENVDVAFPVGREYDAGGRNEAELFGISAERIEGGFDGMGKLIYNQQQDDPCDELRKHSLCRRRFTCSCAHWR